MTDRELMQMALDCLLAWEEESSGYGWSISDQECVEALRARLAQPEPEPVAWMYQHEDTGLTMCVIVQQVGAGFEKNNPRWQKIAPLYTAPPQREWQGLTDEEKKAIYEQADIENWHDQPLLEAVEAKLKEKNT